MQRPLRVLRRCRIVRDHDDRLAQLDAQRAQEPEHLLGAVLLLPERSLFVKFTGPKALLERERAAFLEFCRSARPGE